MLAMRKLIGNQCKEVGFTKLIEAEDGTVAWKKLEGSTTPFGLIICDWNMPTMNGIEFLRKVRGAAKYQALPFIMVTGDLETYTLSEAIKFKVSGHLTKPFSPEAFQTLLKKRSETMKRSIAA
jgi:two-component system chemotaxis response regulator CheY